jgi:alpha-amylase/alpha-mannosidase (GH57 family)
MPLSHEQIVEISRLQNMIRNLEKIKRGSKDEFQVHRVTMDLDKYHSMIQKISPEGIPDNMQETVQASKALKDNDPNMKNKLIAQFPVMKVSPNSNDREINQIATIINVLDGEYMPILGDTHIKFDFAHQSERDTLFKYLENLRRNMKVLTETIEEYAQAEKQEFREQLGRMKNKQSRIFISESYDFLKKVKEFLEAVQKDIRAGNSVIMNLEEKITFNPRFEKSTLLEGRDITSALNEFFEFTKEAMDVINLPNLKI